MSQPSDPHTDPHLDLRPIPSGGVGPGTVPDEPADQADPGRSDASPIDRSDTSPIDPELVDADLAPERPAAAGAVVEPVLDQPSLAGGLAGDLPPAGTTPPPPPTVEPLQGRPDRQRPYPWSVDDVDRFEDRWQEIVVDFVDDPQGAVDRAGNLVADVADALAAALRRADRRIAPHADLGTEATEALRVAMNQQRHLLDQLLRLARLSGP